MKNHFEIRCGWINGVYHQGIGWFRLRNKWGISFKDLKRHSLLFSERYGHKKTFKIFNWSFRILKP